MADPIPGVIPLWRDAPAPPSGAGRWQLSPELALLLAVAARRGSRFAMPAVLLSLGAGLLATLLVAALRAAGATLADPLQIAAVALAWSLLATLGTALLLRGVRLARRRWRW